ncbi:peptide chain release factor N(5)-glutamine methyltransferase [Mycoplasma zalophi]|uniref:peptide chain release factor N(5)-glutamine methyltransferase n=1 Tax=Mycoplasma zalophi TaxID=191287 RepID=A0ABS6DQ44_9MOLU|nr:peptide chain release factor N(5)-glutamine methyltransferase [Mycoplasma zalophi]MBU4690739.1 peptide chain release factor N(5)-glutamine methyltransferase [Mycoplasma zalophi]MBU4692445.1 peptide chain release factor N(5)-glutamine methyltransferase [Mycoplasma zalophi]
MINKEILLREKLRYNLPLEISKRELKLLKKDFPVQRIIGYCEMQSIRVFLNKSTLIPRYETEEVILKCYEFLNKDSEVLDLGTGTGFIGLAIKKNINCKVTLIDKNKKALKMAKKNAEFNNLDVEIFKSNWFSNVYKKYDLIVANPPYLDKSKLKKQDRPKFDPSYALYAKNNGLKDYIKILKDYKKFLKPNGILIFEIDDFVAQYFEKYYPDQEIIKDINNKKRIIVIR